MTMMSFLSRSTWSSEPNDDGPAGEDCAFLTPDGTYSDASCFYRSAFVCELESEDAPCPAGWVDQELDFMSLCYYISNSTKEGGATRMEALFRCRRLANRQEAHLVAINSQAEMDFVTSLIKGRPWDGYWTDLTDSRIEGLWQFSNPSDVSPPIPWAKEPNNRGGHENCVQMYPGGRYNDVFQVFLQPHTSPLKSQPGSCCCHWFSQHSSHSSLLSTDSWFSLDAACM
ncbi:hypothetical protein C0Q70_08985 [Pomacea canaliculata]|uniref:C-type lectin domain-containing protein n=1 Tax=Pomacea canaliculata TaxID=400727 RepID=A0A2T7P8I9_POMCA|nr:hypothetical protein C0Q70_08985 [Pomacea canaliculata]